MPGSVQARVYVSSRFALVLDGSKNMGFIKSVDGGGVKADIVTYQHGGVTDLWRSIGRPKYEDISVQIGMGMSETFYKWIEDFFARKVTRKDGAIVSADFNYAEKSRREFHEALITEVAIPTLDGADKNPGYITVKLTPEWVTYKKGDDNSILQNLYELGHASQKLWKPANFRLEIQGQDCRRVNKIDGFAIKQQILDDKIGSTRKSHRVPGRVEWPNLTVYVPEVDIADWMKWHKDCVEDGKYKPGGVTGAISLLSPNLQKAYLTIDLAGVGIAGITPEKQEANADQIRRYKVELHVEKMAFKYNTKA